MHLFPCEARVPLAAVGGEVALEVGYGASFVCVGVVVVGEELEKDPLCPVVVIGVRGSEFSCPVIAETEHLELRAIALDVALCGYGGVLSRLDGILLGGKPKSVVAHGVEHIVAAEAHVAAIDVRGNVAERMPHV